MGSHAMANMLQVGYLCATSLRDQGSKLDFMPEHLPDRVDRAIVARLQRDGRIANVDLADAISLSPSACLRRVKALEASGIIAGYRAEVSRVRAGLGLTVFIGLKAVRQSPETAAQIVLSGLRDQRLPRGGRDTGSRELRATAAGADPRDSLRHRGPEHVRDPDDPVPRPTPTGPLAALARPDRHQNRTIIPIPRTYPRSKSS